MGYYDQAILKDIEQLGKLLTRTEQISESTLPRLPLQQITYGAPGTGKSFGIDEDLKKYHMTAIRTTFHPDSDYSTFVGAYKPQMEVVGGSKKQTILDYSTLVDKFKEYLDAKPVNITKACTLFGYDYHDSIVNMQNYGNTIVDLVSDAYKSGTTYDSQVRAGMSVYEQAPASSRNSEKKIVYKYSQQAFMKAYVAAWKDLPNPYVLVIEEINRGNCAQVFGDLFQLLDRNDEGFSCYPITPDTDIMQVLNNEFEGLRIPDAEAINSLYTEDVMTDVLCGNKLLLPRNLFIWATMNTSDQSLFPIDSAFKRRWEWKYVPIIDANKGWRILINGVRYDWWSFLDAINKKIWDATRSEDKKLGYFFCKANAENDIITADKFVGKVLFYIYNDVFRDYGFDDAIFKDENDKDNPELLFKDFFLSDGKPREEKIQVFMKNLKVKTEAEIEGEAAENMETIDYEDLEKTDSPAVNKPEPMPDDINMEDDDPTRYSFEGNGRLGKSELALKVIDQYLSEHSGETFDQLKNALESVSMGRKFILNGLLATEKDLKDAAYSIQKKAYGLFRKDRKYKSADGVVFFVNGYWTKANIQSIIDFAGSQGWIVSTDI